MCDCGVGARCPAEASDTLALLLREHDLTRVGDGVGVVRWLVNARCVQRGGNAPHHNGRISQMSYCEVTALSVAVRYCPQAKKDPKWVLAFEQQMSVVS